MDQGRDRLVSHIQSWLQRQSESRRQGVEEVARQDLRQRQGGSQLARLCRMETINEREWKGYRVDGVATVFRLL